MNHYQKLLYFVVLFSVCYGNEKNTPLKQLEGPWMIRNVSENALSIIGKCPIMNIEPSSEDANSDGVILFKSTTVQTFRITIEKLDHEIYQLFYPYDSGSAFLGNVSLLHVDEYKFLITKLHTAGQIYYAVLTKENQTKSDTDKKIEKLWKSTKPKNVSLAATEYENCNFPPQEDIEGHSHESAENPSSDAKQKESAETSDGSTPISSTEKISTAAVNNTAADTTTPESQKLSTEEAKSTPLIKNETTVSISKASITEPSQAEITVSISTKESTSKSSLRTPLTEPTPSSPDKTEKLAVVSGSDSTSKSKLRNSARSNVSSPINLSITLGSLLFLFNKIIFI